MKRLFISALSLTFIFAASLAQAQAADPVRVPALFSKVYVPNGFDSNDQVQFVGEGMFRNTCYRHANTTVRVDESQKTVFVGPVAYEYSGFCLQVILPFERVVDVGILKAGTWKIVQVNGAHQLGEIKVLPALTESPDDYLYAPISQAYFRQVASGAEITLSGEFTSSCLALDQVKVEIQPDVIVVQPIAKMDSGATCKDGRFAFSRVVPVNSIKNGRYLLHVRSMNGNAINTLVSVN
jgi:hypothetical protein